MTTSIFAQTPPLETGVSQDLAKWRSANYSDVRYKLNITLEKGAPLMRGTIEVSVKLTDEGAKNDLVLDWRTTQFQNDKDKPFAEVEKVNEKVVKETVPNGVFDYQTNEEHLIISQKYLKPGENVIKINFASPIKTSGSAITRYVDKEDNAEYIYSLFVPSDASTAFPVFDQPDLKARFTFSIKAFQGWNVISNTKPKLLRDNSPTHSEDIKKLLMTTHFEETKPISTYVFAFAAGDFAEFEDKESSIPSKLYVRKSQVSKLKNTNDRSADIPVRVDKNKTTSPKTTLADRDVRAPIDEVFRLNREGVKFLEDYFDYKFPFPKYDLVLIPEFPFGGMEHAGATFLRETSVIFPTEPTKNDYVSRANVIFHEAAHQWFGDTVTMKWFDDLWLKEGFAEFMAYKTLEKVMPEYNAWKIFYERNKQAAYLTDSTKGTTPIYQEIKNLSAAKSAYGNIVYRKAPSFLKQAEFYLGEKEFQTAVRAFLKKHEYANAEWTDLVKEFETASDNNLEIWAKSWVKTRGLPIVKALPKLFERGSKIHAVTNVNGYVFSENFDETSSLEKSVSWQQNVKVLRIYENGSREEAISLLGARDEKTFVKENGKYLTSEDLKSDKLKKLGNPIFVFPNYQDYGYGIFLLDEKSRDYILANIQTEKDDFLRAMMWGSLWDSVRETELAPEDYVRLVIKVLSTDFSRQTVAEKSITNKNRNINEKPPEGGTQNFSETDESTIQTLLGRVSTAMNYYLSDAQKNSLAPQVEKLLIEKLETAPTVGQKITYFRALQSIGSNEQTRQIFKDLLNDKSKMQNVELKTKDKFDLVTRLLILGDKDAPAIFARLEKTETSDEAKRYAYAAKAGIAAAENKAKFWTDFVSNKEISESWIESAFVPFNSIRHSDLTLPFLEKALAELPNLKKNRKIFFVNGWLASFIGGQKSEEALKIVNEFLDENPNLDRDLRLKILENADNLERAVKIRAKFGK